MPNTLVVTPTTKNAPHELANSSKHRDFPEPRWPEIKTSALCGKIAMALNQGWPVAMLERTAMGRLTAECSGRLALQTDYWWSPTQEPANCTATTTTLVIRTNSTATYGALEMAVPKADAKLLLRPLAHNLLNAYVIDTCSWPIFSLELLLDQEQRSGSLSGNGSGPYSLFYFFTEPYDD